jgi:hypothetical protein
MATLHRLEAPDSTIGGVLITFPSGAKKVASWRSPVPIEPTIEAAKEHVAAVIRDMLPQHLDDVERTNIPSLVAAVQAHIIEWNVIIRTNLYTYAAPSQ